MNKKDKIETMNQEIKSKITNNMISDFQYIELEYKDIKLDIFIRNDKDGHIKLEAFSRGHHVRQHPEHRIMHRPSEMDEPSSDKGDGSLFLALVVTHCNNVFDRPVPYWIGGVTDWWRIKGVCSIQNACKKTKRSGTAYEINNKFFMDWSNKIIIDYLSKLIAFEMTPISSQVPDVVGTSKIAPNVKPSVTLNRQDKDPEQNSISSSLKKTNKSLFGGKKLRKKKTRKKRKTFRKNINKKLLQKNRN